MIVADKMEKNMVTVDRDSELINAYITMQDNDIRQLPVVDKKFKLEGIVTDRDIRVAFQHTNRNVWTIPQGKSVGDIMTTKPVTVYPDTPIQEAAQIILNKKIGGLPVIDKKGILKGILTITDLLEIFLDFLDLFRLSTKLEVETEGQRALEKIIKVIEDNNRKLVNIKLKSSPQSKKTVYALRVSGENVTGIVDALQKMGMKVLNIP